MGNVDASILGSDASQLDQFVGRSKAIRNVLQGGAEPETPLFHSLSRQLLHGLQFFGRSRPIFLSNHVVPKTAGTNKGTQVDCWMNTLFKSLEVLRQTPPVCLQMKVF